MRAAAPARAGIWNRSHYLDKMTLKELVVAYFQYYSIIAYLALTVACLALYAWQPAALVPTLLSAAAAVVRSWP